MEQTIQLKRAYDKESADDGFRIYIDRLWPRGLSHENFHYDLWDKEIAPSNDLRKWFHEDPDNRWEDFCKRYKTELNSNPAFTELKNLVADKSKLTLLYSSHDHLHNNAVVVKMMLKQEDLDTKLK